MAHPQRLERAQALAGDVLDVVTDPDPAGQPSAFRTSLLAWSSIPADSTHHFLLHDDMVLSNSFFERVRRAAEEMPDSALALFAFWNSRNGAAVRQGALAGARWVPAADEYMPVAALMLPRDVAQGYVEWARDKGGTWPDDVLMYRYLKQAGVPRYVAVPSMAEHEDMASLVDNDFQGLRRATCFFEQDPGEGEQPGLTELSAIPFFKLGLAQCAVKTPTGWRTILCEEYLRRFDIELPPRAEFGANWGVWLTAFTMGVVNRFEGHGVDQSGLVIDRALATIAPGGLCHELGAKALADLTPPLHEVAWDGLRFGLAMSPRIKDRSSLSVRVACTGSFVGDYLRHTLADRGYHVTEYDEADVVIHREGESTEGAERTICLTDLHTETPAGDCVLRLGIPYGPGMPSEQTLAQFIRNALLNRPIDLSEAKPVQLVHVKDIADAVEAVLYRSPPSRVYAIANPEITTPEDLCVAIGQSVRPVRTEGTAAKDGSPVPVGRAVKELGWQPSVDLRYGLHTYSQWLAYETDD
jgi:hypothetical protein